MSDRPRLGHVAIVLHAHIPYVLGHGRWPHGVDWLNEVVAETYIPLFRTLEELAEAGLRRLLTLSLSPVLLEQLADERFPGEFERYLGVKEEAAEANAEEFAAQGREELARLAWRARDFYRRIHHDFQHRYRRDLVGALRRLQEGEVVELMTSAATHGYLPLLREDGSVRVQVRLARLVYQRHLGRPPRGMWLPECAYRPRCKWVDPLHPAEGPVGERPGIEEFLADEGLEYFVVDAHLLQGGEEEPGRRGRANLDLYSERYRTLERLRGCVGSPEEDPTADPRSTAPDLSPHAVYLTSSHPFFEKTVAFFTRDAKAALQVWSSEFGYPGDPHYLDFHKKHWPGGLRYWRVTDPKADLAEKEPYQPEVAEERLEEHARHYLEVLADRLSRSEARREEADPVVCVPFDAELFGHWWFEGVGFLERVLRLMSADDRLSPTTCSEALERSRPTRVVRLREGSWGRGGRHLVWCNEQTRWCWECIHEAEARMAALVTAYGDKLDNPLLKGIVAQALRELLLMQASDWQFIISAREAADYAVERLRRHCADFTRLAHLADKVAEGGTLSPGERNFLRCCQERDRLFQEADPSLWRP